MKYNSCFVPVMSVSLFFLANIASANTVEEEFSMCAAAALESRLPEDAVFHVDLSELESVGLSNTQTSASTILDLTLTGKESGKDLGSVVCILDNAGNVVSSVFEDAYKDVALN